MVSLAYLITLVVVLVAVSRADEVANGKTEQVDEKWIYLSGYYRRGWFGANGLSLYGWNPYLYSRYSTVLGQPCYGASIWPINWGIGTRYFVKANDGESAQSVTRRAIDLDADQLVRRDAGELVTCAAHGAAPQTFSLKECIEAVNQLSERKLSTASHGGCKVALVSGNEKVAPGLITAKDLQASVHNILNACANQGTKEAGTSKPNNKIDDKQVAMILTKN